MASGLCSIDGVLVPVGEAQISVTDMGLLRGDGAFEVMRLYGGQPFALEDHLTRLEGSARGLRLELDMDALRGDVDSLLAAADGGDDLLRIVLTRGGRRVVLFEELPEQPSVFALGRITYAPTHLLDGIKSLSYAANMLATRLARERGFDDALLVTPHDRVLECPTKSFFTVTGGVVRTAPLSDHVLDSITRRAVLEVHDVREESITVVDLAEIDEAFVASTIAEVAPVGRIEDHALAAPGPITVEIAARVRAAIGDAVAAS